MPNNEIRSVQELIEVLERDNGNYSGSHWYRGQSDEAWSLSPGYLRESYVPESSLIKRFKQSAALLVDTSPNTSFDWLFLMQHYGVPTRLLDWSENPLVGLYFAVENADKSDVDAALWSLKPSELNKNANIEDGEEEFFIPAFEDEELANYSVETLRQNARSQLKPLAAIATRNNSRIQAQHGVFTIHHHDKSPIDEVGNGSHVVKYVIPGDKKASIKKQLALLGFTKFQLFPELSSIGEIVKGGLA